MVMVSADNNRDPKKTDKRQDFTMWMDYGLPLLKLQRHCNYDIFLSSLACVPLSWKR